MRLANLSTEQLIIKLHLTRQEHTLAKETLSRKTQRSAGQRLVRLISEFKRRKIKLPSYRKSLSYRPKPITF